MFRENTAPVHGTWSWANGDFCRLWLGSTISALGSWLVVVAVAVQVFRLTHSVVATGLTGALEPAPHDGRRAAAVVTAGSSLALIRRS